MNEVESRRAAIIIFATVIGVGFLFPLSAVLVGHWLFHVSLPTLVFISFVLLFVGGFNGYTSPPEEGATTGGPNGDSHSVGSILLLAGHASGLGVLILYFIRLYSQGVENFSWM
jgi:hypothetical protein